MQLTKNFSSLEFACHNGDQVPLELVPNLQKLATNLQALRDALGVPIMILSGYRSPAYNVACGGAKKSQHMEANAADIVIPHLSPVKVHAKILELIASGAMHDGGVGLYNGPENYWVHYDVRPESKRWNG